MKVLITGGNGFIGRRVTQHLRMKGIEVRWASRTRPPTLPQGVEHVVLDMARPDPILDAVSGCTHVIHLAAREDMPVLPPGDPDGELMFQTNVLGTKALLDACRDTGIQKVVVVTSIFTFGWKRSLEPDDGRIPHNVTALRSVYAWSRYQQEFLCLEYAAAGLPVVICAPSVVVGAGDTKLAGPAVKAVARGVIRFVPSGGVNCIDVEDVAQGLLAALEQAPGGRRYALVGHNVTWQAFFSMIARQLGRRPPRVMPAWVIRFGLFFVRQFDRFVRGREPAFLVGPAFLSRPYYFSHTRAVQELGVPSTPLARSLEQTIAWVKEGEGG